MILELIDAFSSQWGSGDSSGAMLHRQHTQTSSHYDKRDLGLTVISPFAGRIRCIAAFPPGIEALLHPAPEALWIHYFVASQALGTTLGALGCVDSGLFQKIQRHPAFKKRGKVSNQAAPVKKNKQKFN